MTEGKTPSFKDVESAFFDKCELNQRKLYNSYMDCSHCDYRCFGEHGFGECNGGGDSQGACLNHYIYEVATGKRPIDKPLWNPPKAPEWFKVGAKLWRKSCNDWVTIKSLTPTAGVDKDGNALFVVEMVASDGSEDEAELPLAYFSPEAPFSESFRKLLGERAWHKGHGLEVRIVGYAYETNTVYFSYTDKDGDSATVGEELKEENFEAVIKTPSWCKVGQWVMDKDTMLWKIDGVNKGLINAISADKEMGYYGCHWRDVKPVRFRPYEYEEAKGLLGKVMEYAHQSGYKRTVLIDSIGCDDGLVLVNGYRQEFLMLRLSATINGLPFGVPVVDEEALKGGEK